MKVTNIEYSKTVAIFLAFNKVEFRSSMRADLDKGENPAEAKQALKELVESNLSNEIVDAVNTLTELKEG